MDGNNDKIYHEITADLTKTTFHTYLNKGAEQYSVLQNPHNCKKITIITVYKITLSSNFPWGGRELFGGFVYLQINMKI